MIKDKLYWSLNKHIEKESRQSVWDCTKADLKEFAIALIVAVALATLFVAIFF